MLRSPPLTRADAKKPEQRSEAVDDQVTSDNSSSAQPTGLSAPETERSVKEKAIQANKESFSQEIDGVDEVSLPEKSLSTSTGDEPTTDDSADKVDVWILAASESRRHAG